MSTCALRFAPAPTSDQLQEHHLGRVGATHLDIEREDRVEAQPVGRLVTIGRRGQPAIDAKPPTIAP